jgi:beta-N-acetylhexosaminidase
MVMTAHVINRQMDPSGLPASLSSKITSYLRDSIGFKGVIITDDLAMGAITNQYGCEEALRLAILAGCDLLCLSNNGGGYNPDLVPKAVDAIFQLVKSNQIPAESIQTSAQQIRSLKKKIHLDPAR